MINSPKALRLHIALLGRVNAGKSSFLNLVTDQQTSITSAIAGTTTDVVEKAQELPPIGPVLWLDTAGFGDSTELSAQRMKKTLKVLERADIVLLVCEGDKIGNIEKQIIDLSKQKDIPLLKIYNKSDCYEIASDDGIKVNSLNKHSKDNVLNLLKNKILDICPKDFIEHQTMLSDLLAPQSTVIMIVPLDYEAPKGRLILPQVQAIRECLDYGHNIMVVKEDNYLNALSNLKTPPALVICDSQVVDIMVKQTPPDIPCTTFSILMARLKGDLATFVRGAQKISNLQENDRILIAESCTHHAVADDIGRVKIPFLLRQKTGKNLRIDFVSGCDFPDNLGEYQLVIQCGGCTFNRRAILSRINQCLEAGTDITNYGVCISELKGVLSRVLEPFKKTESL